MLSTMQSDVEIKYIPVIRVCWTVLWNNFSKIKKNQFNKLPETLV